MNAHDDWQADATLVARTLAGEREAFGPLLLRYYGSVARLCRRLLGPTPEAQDVAQEASLQSFLGLAELSAPERFGAWLHAIAANLARMELRRRRTLSLDALPEGSGMVALWTAAPQSPEAVHAARELHDAIVAALGELSLVNREVVIGFYLEGYSYDELATLLGVPVSTIKGRLFKGRSQLRQRLAPAAREVLAARHQQPKELLMNSPEAIEIEVESIRKSMVTGASVVWLRAKESGAVLPIWIGAFEAEAIAMVLQQRPPHRPITHDLALQMATALGGQVRRVTVNRLVDKTFYAEIELAVGKQQQVLDARPSDAIALAVRVGAPIYVARAVLDAAGAASEDEWTERHAHEIAGQGPLARTELIERTWALQLAGSPGTPEQSQITLAEFTSAEWPGPQYQREITWDGRDMLAIALPAAEPNSTWLIVPTDFWRREATQIIRPTAPQDAPETPQF